MGLAYACRDAPSGLAFGRRLLGLRAGRHRGARRVPRVPRVSQRPLGDRRDDRVDPLAPLRREHARDRGDTWPRRPRELGHRRASYARRAPRVRRRRSDGRGRPWAARPYGEVVEKNSRFLPWSSSVRSRVGRGGGEAGSGYLALADLYALALDADGEVRALATAIRDGAEVPSLEDRLERLSAQKLGGGRRNRPPRRARLPRARGRPLARPRSLSVASGPRSGILRATAQGAVAAWVDAARRAPFRASTTLRRDLVDFAGHEDALECLLALAEHEPDPARSGSLLAEAAHVAVALRDDDRTFDLASRALHRNPAHTDALASAEAGTRDDRKEGALSSPLFARRLARAREVRASRGPLQGRAFLRGPRRVSPRPWSTRRPRSWRCPPKGRPFSSSLAPGERAGDPSAVFHAVDRLAGVTKSPQARAAWLVRAAETGEPTSGVSERADALLRAFVLLPDPVTLDKLARAIDRQLTLLPQEADLVVLRFGRAARAALSKGEGPRRCARRREARISRGGPSRKTSRSRGDCVERAFSCDGDIDEYRSLSRVAPQLAEAEGGRAAFGRAVALSEQPYSSLGAAAFAFLGRGRFGLRRGTHGPKAARHVRRPATRTTTRVSYSPTRRLRPTRTPPTRSASCVRWAPERLAEAQSRGRRRRSAARRQGRGASSTRACRGLARGRRAARDARAPRRAVEARPHRPPVRVDELFASARASAAAGDRRAATATLERIVASECPVGRSCRGVARGESRERRRRVACRRISRRRVRPRAVGRRARRGDRVLALSPRRLRGPRGASRSSRPALRGATPRAPNRCAS
jgi:hypothetical protein